MTQLRMKQTASLKALALECELEVESLSEPGRWETNHRFRIVDPEYDNPKARFLLTTPSYKEARAFLRGVMFQKNNTAEIEEEGYSESRFLTGSAARTFG